MPSDCPVTVTRVAMLPVPSRRTSTSTAYGSALARDHISDSCKKNIQYLILSVQQVQSLGDGVDDRLALYVE